MKIEKQNEIPDEPGYYFVRMFNHKADPSLCLLTKNFAVLLHGDYKRYSAYEDVKCWLEKVNFNES